MVTREITINSALGLAVAVALDGVYVIDIRNPFDPRVLNKIVELAPPAVNADGSPVMITLNGSQAVVEHNGTLYLANPASGVNAINLGAGDKISCNPNIPCAP